MTGFSRLFLWLCLRAYPKEWREARRDEIEVAFAWSIQKFLERWGSLGYVYTLFRFALDAIGFGLAERFAAFVDAWHGRYALSSFRLKVLTRRLRRHPVAAVVSVAALSIGFGMERASVSLESMLLASNTSGNTFVAWQVDNEPGGGQPLPIAPWELQRWSARSQTTKHLGGFDANGAKRSLIRTADGWRSVGVLRVTSNFLPAIGVEPGLGRLHERDDQLPGKPPALVLAHRFWMTTFGGDSTVLGGIVDLDVGPARIVGVAPSGFEDHLGSDAWRGWQVGTGATPLHVIGSLADGARFEDARAELDSLSRNVDAELGGRATEGVMLLPWSRAVTVPARQVSPVLLATAVLVTTMAGVNLIILLLLGTRGDIERNAGAFRSAPFFDESPVFSAAVLVACAQILTPPLFRVTRSFGKTLLPYTEGWFDNAAYAGTLTVGATGAVIVAAVWAVQWLAKRRDHSMVGRLREWCFDALVAYQFAGAVVLTVAGGMFAHTAVNMQSIDPGFQANSLFYVRFAPAGFRLNAQEKVNHDDPELIVARLFHGATRVTAAPFSQYANDVLYRVDYQDSMSGLRNPWANVEGVSPNYFAVVGLGFLEGDNFSQSGMVDGEPGDVIVSQSFAEEFWPRGRAVGRRLRFEVPNSRWFRVVGVVEDSRYRSLGTPRLNVYLPGESSSGDPVQLLVRDAGLDRSQLDSIEQILRRATPGLPPVLEVASVAEVIGQLTIGPTASGVSALFVALLALVISAVGFSTAMSAAMTRRGKDIAIRFALGARPAWAFGASGCHTIVAGGSGVLLGAVASVVAAKSLSPFLDFQRPDFAISLSIAVAGLAMATCLYSVSRKMVESLNILEVLRSE